MKLDLYHPSKMFTKEEYIHLVKMSEGKRRILEFGPGTSTFALIESSCNEIHTCESEDKWIEITQRRFAKFPQVRIHKYQNMPEIIIDDLYGRFDLAFVDAPKGIKTGPSRLNTLKFSFDRTDLVILHDANRQHEQESIKLLGLKYERLTQKLWLLMRR